MIFNTGGLYMLLVVVLGLSSSPALPNREKAPLLIVPRGL
jgi:hypothetical protein